jgi:hypothetical protein
MVSLNFNGGVYDMVQIAKSEDCTVSCSIKNIEFYALTWQDLQSKMAIPSVQKTITFQRWHELNP